MKVSGYITSVTCNSGESKTFTNVVTPETDEGLAASTFTFQTEGREFDLQDEVTISIEKEAK